MNLIKRVCGGAMIAIGMTGLYDLSNERNETYTAILNKRTVVDEKAIDEARKYASQSQSVFSYLTGAATVGIGLGVAKFTDKEKNLQQAPRQTQ